MIEAPLTPTPNWLKPGDKPQLGRNEIHVWRLRLEADAGARSELVAWLAPGELARAQGFRFEPARRDFLLRRAMLRHVLGDYLDVAPAAVRFSTNEYGKPAVVTIAALDDLRFSYSHSGKLALLAVTRGREVGVDLEQHWPMPDALQLASSFFASGEVAALKQLPEAELEPAFFDCWTRKEAFIKALGLGLSFPLNRFAVSLGEPARLLELHDAPTPPGDWTLRSLPVGPGFSAALAVEGADVEVRCQDWR
jgi:4'-phosphopantetheinyl transferase